MKILETKQLVSMINSALGADFCMGFAYRRKKLAKLGRAPARARLFEYDEDSDRDWAINQGGGTEIQFHLFVRDNHCGYGLGFNAQYVPYNNDKSPKEYMLPFAKAYMALRESDVVKQLKASGFVFCDGTEDGLISCTNDYYLFGKVIEFDTNNELSQADFDQMIVDIKGNLFALYCAIFELKNKGDEEMSNKQNLIDLLLANHNLILTGAPGTGKTYLAKKIACKITQDAENDTQHIAFVQFHPSYDYTDFVEGLRPTPPDENGNVGFVRQNGIFKEFCRQAILNQQNNFDDSFKSLCQELDEKYSKDNPLELKTARGTPFRVFLNTNGNLSLITGMSNNIQGSLTAEKMKTFLTSFPYPYWACYFRGVIEYLKERYNLSTTKEAADQKYVIIIDEINRGDIAKIFGELFYAIDPSYRGDNNIRIHTQYQNLIEEGDVFKSGFFVPKNVYIIGTMNDIDRNVETIDFAVRRRFIWKKITTEETQDAILSNHEADVVAEAKSRMDALNRVIRIEKSLGENFCIGAAYFKKIEDCAGKWDNLWNYHLKSLLDEYVRGLPDAEKLMDNFKNAYERIPHADAPANN